MSSITPIAFLIVDLFSELLDSVKMCELSSWSGGIKKRSSWFGVISFDRCFYGERDNGVNKTGSFWERDTFLFNIWVKLDAILSTRKTGRCWIWPIFMLLFLFFLSSADLGGGVSWWKTLEEFILVDLALGAGFCCSCCCFFSFEIWD